MQLGLCQAILSEFRLTEAAGYDNKKGQEPWGKDEDHGLTVSSGTQTLIYPEVFRMPLTCAAKHSAGAGPHSNHKISTPHQLPLLLLFFSSSPPSKSFKMSFGKLYGAPVCASFSVPSLYVILYESH